MPVDIEWVQHRHPWREDEFTARFPDPERRGMWLYYSSEVLLVNFERHEWPMNSYH